MKPTRKVKIQLLCFYASMNFVLIPAKVITAENFPERVKRTVSDTLVIRQEKQKAEDKWVLEKEKLAARYDALTLKREKSASRRPTAETKHCLQGKQYSITQTAAIGYFSYIR